MKQKKNIKLLLVDDEVKFLNASAERLKVKGFDVKTADNGTDAVKLAEENLFDVAVIDLKMPGIDGGELLKILKDKHKYLEIIILTGHGSVNSAVECTKLGAFDYLEKPYYFDSLIDSITRAYEQRLKKKYETDQKRMEEIRKLATGQSPLGILKELARMDDEVK